MTEKELRNLMPNTLKGYLGCAEGSAKHRDIVNTYNSIKPLPRNYKLTTRDAWCAATVSAMAAKCGLLDIIPAECSCYYQVELWKKMGRWVENDAYVPKIGDIIYYDWQDDGKGDNKGVPDHVGIVCSVSGKTITSIEGNKNDTVAYRTITVNGKNIRGYGIPDYASKAEKIKQASTPKTEVKPEAKATAKTATAITVSLPELKKGSKGASVKAMQGILIALGYSCGKDGADGDFGANTEKALGKFQKAKGLKVTKIVDANTWTKLLKG